MLPQDISCCKLNLGAKDAARQSSFRWAPVKLLYISVVISIGYRFWAGHFALQYFAPLSLLGLYRFKVFRARLWQKCFCNTTMAFNHFDRNPDTSDNPVHIERSSKHKQVLLHPPLIYRIALRFPALAPTYLDLRSLLTSLTASFWRFAIPKKMEDGLPRSHCDEDPMQKASKSFPMPV